MPYYPTIDEDLARAKDIVANGKGHAACTDFRPDHNGECLNCDEWLDGHAGYISAGDIFAAYKLLESFIEVVELMGPNVIKVAMRLQRRVEQEKP